jgi:uncharacterized membrane protein
MSEVGHLWAVGFDDVSRAEQVRGKVIELAERHSLVLVDWTVAVRFADGSFTVDGEPPLQASEGGRLARFLAGLALGAPPLTAAAAGAMAGGTHVETCISDEFIREVRGLMQPGTSALFVIDTDADLNRVLDAMRGIGGRVLKTNVDLNLARLIQSTLARPSGQNGDEH